MAEITPFRGTRFNPDKIDDLSKVTAPPYDVISEKERDMFYEAHPANVIRLILGKHKEGDSKTESRYTRAADYFKKWRDDETLIRDESPGIYFVAVDFKLNESIVTRFGMVALAKLEPFEKGVILPHEKTFSKTKSERLELMKACQVNFSPIFSVYQDKKGFLSSLRDDIMKENPDSDFVDGFGHRHRMWRIADPSIHDGIRDAMKDVIIYIADGHHRYETALNYKNWLASTDKNFNDQHNANHIMMYLCDMDDPGMVILPAHRMLKEVDMDRLGEIGRKARDYFDITTIPFGPDNRKEKAAEFNALLAADTSKNRIGVAIKNRSKFYLFTPKTNIMEQTFKDIPPAMLKLDVTVLTQLIMMELLGFDQQRLDNEKMINYSSVADTALEAVAHEECDVAFILNSTKMSQVQEISREGLIMPRKSTYFYPKVLTGHVMSELRSEEHTSELQSLVCISYAVHCAPAGYLVADSGPLCFGSANSAHVDLFWAYFVAFWVYFELF